MTRQQSAICSLSFPYFRGSLALTAAFRPIQKRTEIETPRELFPLYACVCTKGSGERVAEARRRLRLPSFRRQQAPSLLPWWSIRPREEAFFLITSRGTFESGERCVESMCVISALKKLGEAASKLWQYFDLPPRSIFARAKKKNYSRAERRSS